MRALPEAGIGCTGLEAVLRPGERAVLAVDGVIVSEAHSGPLMCLLP